MPKVFGATWMANHAVVAGYSRTITSPPPEKVCNFFFLTDLFASKRTQCATYPSAITFSFTSLSVSRSGATSLGRWRVAPGRLCAEGEGENFSLPILLA